MGRRESSRQRKLIGNQSQQQISEIKSNSSRFYSQMFRLLSTSSFRVCFALFFETGCYVASLSLLQICYVVEDDAELLVLPASTTHSLGLQVFIYAVAGNGTQDMHMLSKHSLN